MPTSPPPAASADTPAATVAIHRPAAALEPWVTFYYFVTAHRPVTDFLYPEWGNVRLALDGDWRVSIAGRYEGVPSGLTLFGPTDRRTLVTASPGRMLGFGLTPLGWNRLIGGDTAAMANAVRPLQHELGEDPQTLAQGLRDDADEAASIRRWDALLLALVDARCPPADRRAVAIDRALRRGPADVATFAQLLGLSERSLHRACLDSFGFAPKRLLRRQRFLRTLGRVRSAVRDPVSPSLGDEYYDLPQFYRDFRDFMGMSARDYFSHPRDLMGPAAVAQIEAGVTLSFALAPPPDAD